MSSSSDSIEKKPKRKIFEDSDDEENNNLTENFDNALKKKQFLGEKGKYLFNLQNTYLSDSRFKLDKKFKGDINIKKLPSNLKNFTKKNNDYEYKDNNIIADDENIQEEKNKNLSILSNILPNSAFLEHRNKESNIKKIIQKRFDPLLNLGDFSVEPLKVEVKEKKKDDENKIILEKGVQIFNDPLKNPIYKNKHEKLLKKREREKLIENEVNRINNDMNQEIIVNYDMWKKSIQSKEKIEFKLFDDDNNEDKNGKENIKIENKEIKDLKENKEKEFMNKEKEKLKNKRKREKEKQKQKLRKEKEKKNKEEKRKNEEKMDKIYKTNLINDFGEDKVNNYLKYMEMIKEKKQKHKKQNNK
jgi:hypothetical protein